MTADLRNIATDPCDPLDTPPRPSPPGPAAGRRGTYSGPGRRARRRPYRQLSPVGQWMARAHAARPGPGRFVCPTLAEIQAKLPPGYRPVHDRAAALARFAELPGTAWLRSDSYATRWAVWQALIDFADHDTGIAVVDQDRLGERAAHYRGRRVPRTTAGDHLRALADEHAIHVDPGASKEALGSDRNRASVYLVIEPVVEEPVDQDDAGDDVPLTPEQLAEVDRLAAQLDELAAASAAVGDELRHLPEGSTPTRVEDITQPRTTAPFSSSTAGFADETADTPPHSVLGSSPSQPPEPARPSRPERFATHSGPERAAGLTWIAAVHGWNPKRSRFAALRIEEELRKITGPFFAAGWSPLAVARAFQVQPDGTPWPGPLPTLDQRDSRDQPRIRNLWAVLTHRLAAWRDPLGHPLDPPVPTSRPRRGRPRNPPTSRPGPPPPARSAQAEAEIAAWRARDNQRRAEQAAAAAAREARRRLDWRPAPGDVDQAPTGRVHPAYLRAQVERRSRD